MAARKFGNHPDDGGKALPLGMIAYQGCGFYSFAQSIPEDVLPQPPTTSILGQPVWLAEGKEYVQARNARPTTDTYLMALPKPDLVIACNDRNFLTQVLSRMTATPSTQAFPPTLPEWKYVDRSKPLWALRHFRQERALEDPSFPNNVGLFQGYNVSAPVGVVVIVDGPNGRVIGRFIASSPENPWKDLVSVGDFSGQAETHQVAPGVWELSAPADSESGGYMVFALMAILGFVVLV